MMDVKEGNENEPTTVEENRAGGILESEDARPIREVYTVQPDLEDPKRKGGEITQAPRGQLIMVARGYAIFFPAAPLSSNERDKRYVKAFVSLDKARKDAELVSRYSAAPVDAPMPPGVDRDKIPTPERALENVRVAFHSFVERGLAYNYKGETMNWIVEEGIVDMSVVWNLVLAFQGMPVDENIRFKEIGGSGPI